MKLLHIDSSITGADSVSRQVSGAVVEALVASNVAIVVKTRDLASEPLPHLTLGALPVEVATAAAGEMAPPPLAENIQSHEILEEFLDADVIVIGVGMYNFAVPSQLKAWIDRVLVAGKTFQYTAEGPQGLVGSKRVIVALSRGGLYGADSPYAPAEHAETYLRVVLGFIGIAAPEFIIVEGVQMGPDQRKAAVEAAITAANQMKG